MMSIDAAVGRIHEIATMQQHLSDSASTVGLNPAAGAIVPTGGATGATGQSFANTLASAQVASATAPATTTSSGGAFVPHGGQYGFFPDAGKDYTAGEEPEIAARLDALGKALHLHLVGISGYRTPEHSVAVGGFANDPHTRGEASDTPGIEQVPESTLKQFGLTRPFAGTAEADHIQLA
jgi:hypothetical protein